MSENILANLALKNLGVNIEDEEQREGWKIENDSQADWALDKIRESEAEYRRLEMVVNDKIKQLVLALEKEKEKLDMETGFFRSKLLEYFNTVSSKKKTKTTESYKLPSGRLVLKHKQPRFERDEDKLVAWLETNNMTDLVKVKKYADWAGLKADTEVVGNQVVSKSTGEIIDGVVAVPQSPEFIVEV